MEKRLIMPTILSIILLTIAVVLSFLPAIMGGGTASQDFLPIIPGENLYLDITLSMLIPFTFMILFVFFGTLVSPGYVRLHKLIKLNKYDYFVYITEKKRSGVRILLRSFFPGLLAINVAIYISLWGGINHIIHYNGADPQSLNAVIEYASIIIGIPIASMIIIPIWLLDYSGLMCAKRVESYDRPVSPDIESVGKFYIKMITGYVGISTIVSYSLILANYLGPDQELRDIVLVLIGPILIAMFFLPFAVIMEMRTPKTNAQLSKYYEKLRIDTTPKTVKIE